MAFVPNVAVDSGSDFSTIATGEVPLSQGGTITETSSDNDLVASIQQQGPVPQRNPFEEVNLFVGEIARGYAIAPMAAIRLIERVLQAMREQTYHA